MGYANIKTSVRFQNGNIKKTQPADEMRKLLKRQKIHYEEHVHFTKGFITFIWETPK